MSRQDGQYYFNYLVNGRQLESFRELFGDENADYSTALQNYYARTRTLDWQANYISAYASSHPLEDRAESWAHYLLMKDGLETAETEGLLKVERNIDAAIDQWIAITVKMNEMARSIGVEESYPFIISRPVRAKLRFIDEVVAPVAAAEAIP